MDESERRPQMEALKVYPNPKPHALIRSRMHKLGADGNYMARQLGMSPASFSHRLTGRLPWHADEMYAVMDILKIPQESMHECFPDMRKKGARR